MHPIGVSMAGQKTMTTPLPGHSGGQRGQRSCQATPFHGLLREASSQCRPERRNRSVLEYTRIPSTARRWIMVSQQEHAKVIRTAYAMIVWIKYVDISPSSGWKATTPQ